MEYRYFSHSGIGKRPKNEDCIVPNEKNGTSQSFVLCDGLGGNGDGDVAANFVAGQIYNQLEQLQTLAADHAHAIVEQTSAASATLISQPSEARQTAYSRTSTQEPLSQRQLIQH